jgi:hypothetical protein
MDRCISYQIETCILGYICISGIGNQNNFGSLPEQCPYGIFKQNALIR